MNQQRLQNVRGIPTQVVPVHVYVAPVYVMHNDSITLHKAPDNLILPPMLTGANLEVANHVIIIHPYCPASVQSVSVVPLAQAQAFEQQAVGRVLRFPQSKEVHVYRFYSLGTPEEELYVHWGWAGASQTEAVCRRVQTRGR